MITPMRTQLTYEGLIDELYTIKSTFVELDASFFTPKGSASSINTKPKKVLLSGADTVFAQIRDQSFENQRLYERVLQFAGEPPVQRQWDWERELCARNMDNSFFEFLEDVVLANEAFTTPLKIACIYSIVNNGFKQKQFDQFRRDFCHAYGPKHLLTFQNLEKLGLLKVHSSSAKNSFSQISKSLKLINDYTSKLENNDVSYVYAGFAPISIRLIQIASNTFNGSDSQNLGVTWKNAEDTLSLLPGKTFEKSIIPNAAKEFRSKKRNGPIYTLIVFIGGCTLSEISAIRKLGQNDNRKYIVLTTSVVNGSRMLKSLVIE
ncbi:Vacuolar protein sorting-associated protein 33A [Boothiomyces macroporosus]|uniref:Vacuolar protein sorting-associated protein 33A n=1 Tax=Boothiomyces macroporosus TaxID=261099 RepID=A0AAD5UHQ5_9FUNG|nr:Vacuolar protein sorting-associated protein 33A [Boothiomyces macroporosus]